MRSNAKFFSSDIPKQPGANPAVSSHTMLHLHSSSGNPDNWWNSLRLPPSVSGHISLAIHHREHDHQVQAEPLDIRPTDRTDHPSILLLFANHHRVRCIHPNDGPWRRCHQSGFHYGTLQRSDVSSVGQSIHPTNGPTAKNALLLHPDWHCFFGDDHPSNHSSWFSIPRRDVPATLLHFRKSRLLIQTATF